MGRGVRFREGSYQSFHVNDCEQALALLNHSPRVHHNHSQRVLRGGFGYRESRDGQVRPCGRTRICQIPRLAHVPADTLFSAPVLQPTPSHTITRHAASPRDHFPTVSLAEVGPVR